MKKILIVLIVILVLIVSFVLSIKYVKNTSYQTYSECVEQTGLPCKHYFVGDFGEKWLPSIYRTKEECDAKEKIVGSVCIIPEGEFKEIRWISLIDFERTIKNK